MLLSFSLSLFHLFLTFYLFISLNFLFPSLPLSPRHCLHLKKRIPSKPLVNAVMVKWDHASLFLSFISFSHSTSDLSLFHIFPFSTSLYLCLSLYIYLHLFLSLYKILPAPEEIETISQSSYGKMRPCFSLSLFYLYLTFYLFFSLSSSLSLSPSSPLSRIHYLLLKKLIHSKPFGNAVSISLPLSLFLLLFLSVPLSHH